MLPKLPRRYWIEWNRNYCCFAKWNLQNGFHLCRNDPCLPTALVKNQTNLNWIHDYGGENDRDENPVVQLPQYHAHAKNYGREVSHYGVQQYYSWLRVKLIRYFCKLSQGKSIEKMNIFLLHPYISRQDTHFFINCGGLFIRDYKEKSMNTYIYVQRRI